MLCTLAHYHCSLGHLNRNDRLLMLLRTMLFLQSQAKISAMQGDYCIDSLYLYNLICILKQPQKTCKRSLLFSLLVSLSILSLSFLPTLSYSLFYPRQRQTFQSSGSTNSAEICQLSEEFTERIKPVNFKLTPVKFFPCS